MKYISSIAVLLAILGLSASAEAQELYEEEGTEWFSEEGTFGEQGFGEEEGFLGDEGLYGEEGFASDEGLYSDEYGYYDQNYEWNTDEGWFDSWYGDSDWLF